MFSTLWSKLASRIPPRTPECLPIRIDRRRVYMLPTRFGLFFGAALAVMGLGALNYNNNPALLLAFLLAGVAQASLIQAHLQLSGLRLDALGAEPVAAGMPIALRLSLGSADTRARHGLQLDADGAHASFDLLQGHGEAVLQMPTQRRGWLDLPRIRVSTVRPFGLVRAWAWLWPDPPLLVYPAPELQGPPLPAGIGDRGRARLHPAGDEPHHLRTYRQGDAKRAIAWKASARRDTLLVREYEQPVGVDIALDWAALAGVDYELRIRRLARWVDEAERENRRYRLTLPRSPPLGPAQGAAHRHACLRALALLPQSA